LSRWISRRNIKTRLHNAELERRCGFQEGASEDFLGATTSLPCGLVLLGPISKRHRRPPNQSLDLTIVWNVLDTTCHFLLQLKHDLGAVAAEPSVFQSIFILIERDPYVSDWLANDFTKDLCDLETFMSVGDPESRLHGQKTYIVVTEQFRTQADVVGVLQRGVSESSKGDGSHVVGGDPSRQAVFRGRRDDALPLDAGHVAPGEVLLPQLLAKERPGRKGNWG
jgi:hypothetical protein